jgi:SAM-dependent methyltransferase
MAYIAAKVRDKIRAGVIRSAEVIVDVIADEFDPATVVDVGCGEGWFCREFRGRGVEAFGVDGDKLPEVDMVVDLTSAPYPDLGGYDLAICLEVAEHLEPECAPAFVEWLCKLAPIVVFSAAVPGQGGPGHVNERPPEYWSDLFAEFGYVGSGALRDRLWDDGRVDWWYRQNMLVFGAHNLPAGGCELREHPEMLAWLGRG